MTVKEPGQSEERGDSNGDSRLTLRNLNAGSSIKPRTSYLLYLWSCLVS